MSKVKAVSMTVMALLYIGLGINHFVNTDFYLDLMPSYLPAHTFLIYLSGVCEIVLGALLLPRVTRPWAAWGIIAMLLAFMPVHIHMLVNASDYPEVPYWGLVIRIPMQALFMLWAWWYTRPG